MRTSPFNIRIAGFTRRAFFCTAFFMMLMAHHSAAAQNSTDQHSLAQTRSLFDGKTLTGWEGTSDLFRIENGAIVGGRLEDQIASNAFLCSTDEFSDFELRMMIRLDGPGDNAGVQFRSRRLESHHEVSGYQADVGTVSASWFNEVIGSTSKADEGERSPVWGSLYDESRRNRYLAWGMPEDVTPVVHVGGWNELVVRAEGSRIRIWINDLQTVDYIEQDHIPRSGSICLQIHGGAPAEAWHRDIHVTELPGSTISFESKRLDNVFYSEGANYGDIDDDGINDLVSGPYWYQGPEYGQRHAYYEPKPFDPAGYSDNFFAHVLDFNDDGFNDILIIGFPGQVATWYENPGTPDAASGNWAAHVVFDIVDNESPWWTDITGDGRPEIVAITTGRYGYIEPDWSHPDMPWTFHPISPDSGLQRFTHGLGVGDVNQDGRDDIMERAGWWEQPPSLAGDPVWKFHEVNFSERGGSQMYAYDVDGDGDNDVITGLAAHGYGLAWYENVGASTERDRTEGDLSFIQHIIMNERPEESAFGIAFAELHAIDLIDMDGDGVKDIVTGKRWWSHGAQGDPDINSKAWLYWFQTVRSVNRTSSAEAEGGIRVEFVPHLIDDNSGVGVQIIAGDIDGNGRPDIVVGNKTGTSIHMQR